MNNIALIFPGQGSQYAGMGKDLYEKYPDARQILDKADEVLGFSLTKLCFEGPVEELNLTVNTQPAILAVSYAIYSLLKKKGIAPKLMAGHSLGEYSALLAAGCIGYEDALKLVRKRAQLMQQACAPEVGAMAAVVGIERDNLIEICKTASSKGVVEAVNFNCPEQIVIAGEKQAVLAAMEMAQGQKAKLVTLLPVSIPSHCSLMKSAGQELENYLKNMKFNNPAVPLVTNVDAAVVKDAESLKSALVKQLSSPVLWEDSINKMTAEGIDTFIEAGPGTVLAKLLKRINKNAAAHSVSDADSLEKFISLL